MSWDEVVRVGTPTLVQVPDRFRGAFVMARAAVLGALAEAEARGEAEQEWKALLIFDGLLLARPGGGARCAETLEECLAWFWGGQ